MDKKNLLYGGCCTLLIMTVSLFLYTKLITSQGERMLLMSDDFQNNELMPQALSCDGEDKMPRLVWQNVPSDTKSFALICDDPDAPGKTWVHWVLYDIPARVNRIATEQDIVTNKIKQGKNDFNKNSWGGPCPPSADDAHHYTFTLYALDTMLNLPPGIGKQQLLDTMRGHILGSAILVGVYKRMPK